MESSAVALALACLYIHFLLIFVILDIAAKWGIMKSVFTRGLPIGPIATAVSFVVLPVLFSFYRSNHSMKAKRNIVNRFRNFKMSYSVLYIILTSSSFIAVIVLLIMNR